ncbi:nucleotidyltransferase domain-containing protein [Microbacterium alcoholitolerans]|uniref:nucleotidyltransferase domain-containing protein n=1 Tax=Microbacterium sp. YY-04 TaxID=3421637 RepID=UPI003D17DCD4
MGRAAEVLRKARRESGLTQTALAAVSGVPQSVISAYENGRREPSFGALDHLISAAGLAVEVTPRARPGSALRERVLEHSAELHRVLEPLGAREITLFGSVARGDDTADSDIDLVVDVAPNISMFDLLRMQREAEKLLGRKVDLVPRDGLKPAVALSLAREAVRL